MAVRLYNMRDPRLIGGNFNPDTLLIPGRPIASLADVGTITPIERDVLERADRIGYGNKDNTKGSGASSRSKMERFQDQESKRWAGTCAV